MRRFGHIILLVGLLVVILGSFKALREAVTRLAIPQDAEELSAAESTQDTARGTIVYRLDPERWTTFPFPGNISEIRLLTHADIANVNVPKPDTRWRYGIEIEFLDAAGKVINRRTQYFRTQLVTFEDNVTGTIVTARRYADDPALPLSVDRLLLNLSDLSRAVAIRLRAAETDPGLLSINARLYIRRPFNEANMEALWERLSIVEKKSLSVGFVFPPGLLTTEERDAILRSRYSPFGPSGIAGQDYLSRSLLIYEAPGQRTSPERPEQNFGIYVAPDRRIGLRLPEGGAQVRFIATPLDLIANEAALAAGVSVRLTLTTRSEDAEPDRVLVLKTDATGRVGPIPLQGQVVEIVTDQPVRLRATVSLPDGRLRDLIDDIPAIRTYTATPQTPLKFRIVHEGDRVVPVRLDLRCDCPLGTTVGYRLLTTAGKSVDRGKILLESEPSEYDRLADAPDKGLSEATRVYFALPPEVARLEINTGTSVHVAAYSRPLGLPRTFEIPESDFALATGAGLRLSWYPIRPDFADRFVRRLAAPLVELPARLPESRVDLAEGDYEWEQFRPTGDWLAREAFQPRAPGILRDRARSNAYVPIPAGRKVTYSFAARLPGTEATPEVLAFMAKQQENAKIRLMLDGQPVETFSSSGPFRRYVLPQVVGGDHVLQLEAPPGTEAFVNLTDAADAPFLQRTLLRLRPGTTDFDIEKRGPERELLSLAAFPAKTGLGERVDMAATLSTITERPGVLDDWTLHQRRFSIRIGPEPAETRLLPSGTLIGPRRVMFFPLGSDLPPGIYRISLTLEGDQEMYLLFSRTSAGRRDSRDLILEAPSDADR